MNQRPQARAITLSATVYWWRPVRRTLSPTSKANTPAPLLNTKPPPQPSAKINYFYVAQRGIDTEKSRVDDSERFCKEVFRELPMEFAVKRENF